MKERIKILHLINHFSHSSGAIDRALAIDSDKFDVTICAYYKKDSNIAPDSYDTDKRLVSLKANKRIDFKAWIKLYKLIKEKEFDIIHTHHHLTGILARIIKLFKLNSVKVHSFGNNYSNFSLFARMLHNLTFFLEDSIICVSKEVKNSFNKFEELLVKDKYNVIYNGINIKEIKEEKVNQKTERKKLGIKENEFLIGNIGRLIPQKDQTTLIKSFAQVKKSNSKTKMIIIGAGVLEKKLKQLANDLGVLEDIIFTGYIKRRRVYRILYSLDLFVMTSLWEGFSAAALQAMAVGNPVILTNIPSFNEMIKDKESGIIIPTESPKVLAKEIEKLIQDQYEANRLGDNAQERVYNNFTVAETASQYVELYRRLLNRSI